MMMGKINAYCKPLSLTYSLRGNIIQNLENGVRPTVNGKWKLCKRAQYCWKKNNTIFNTNFSTLPLAGICWYSFKRSETRIILY